MKCVRCNRPIGQAAVMVGAYAYFHDGRKCIALEAGHNVEVMGYDENNPWYFTKWRVSADALTPAPSRYLGGAIP